MKVRKVVTVSAVAIAIASGPAVADMALGEASSPPTSVRPTSKAHSQATTTQPLTGAYKMTDPSGITDWTFTPCGDKCLDVKVGTWPARATPAVDTPTNWQWNLANVPNAITCAADGSKRAAPIHYVLDPKKMTGWAQPFNHNPTCPGDQATEDGLFWSSAVDFTVAKA